MGGGSPRQKRDLIKQIKGKLFGGLTGKSVPELERLARLSTEELLPPGVASNPSHSEEDGPSNLVLRFEYLNFKVCRLQQADAAKMSSLLEKFKRITETTAQQCKTSGLIRRPIKRDGDYAELFNGLGDDIDNLYEIEISGYGRFYGFIVEDKFYVVAVDTVHRNTR